MRAFYWPTISSNALLAETVRAKVQRAYNGKVRLLYTVNGWCVVDSRRIDYQRVLHYLEVITGPLGEVRTVKRKAVKSRLIVIVRARPPVISRLVHVSQLKFERSGPGEYRSPDLLMEHAVDLAAAVEQWGVTALMQHVWRFHDDGL